MTDEKEMIKRIKNSFKAKKSHSEITRKLQQKGYKLEYIHALINKATKGKKIILISVIAVLILISVLISAYSILFIHEKIDIANPLEGFKVNFAQRQNQSPETKEIYIKDIEITPEFISYLLNEIGAWQLRKNPLTFEEPIINFKIDNQNFYSVIDGSIETNKGLLDEADMQFNTNKEEIITAMLSETPEAVFKESIQNNDTQIEIIASEAELFAKGYPGLYESLN